MSSSEEYDSDSDFDFDGEDFDDDFDYEALAKQLRRANAVDEDWETLKTSYATLVRSKKLYDGTARPSLADMCTCEESTIRYIGKSLALPTESGKKPNFMPMFGINQVVFFSKTGRVCSQQFKDELRDELMYLFDVVCEAQGKGVEEAMTKHGFVTHYFLNTWLPSQLPKLMSYMKLEHENTMKNKPAWLNSLQNVAAKLKSKTPFCDRFYQVVNEGAFKQKEISSDEWITILKNWVTECEKLKGRQWSWEEGAEDRSPLAENEAHDFSDEDEGLEFIGVEDEDLSDSDDEDGEEEEEELDDLRGNVDTALKNIKKLCDSLKSGEKTVADYEAKEKEEMSDLFAGAVANQYIKPVAFYHDFTKFIAEGGVRDLIYIINKFGLSTHKGSLNIYDNHVGNAAVGLLCEMISAADYENPDEDDIPFRNMFIKHMIRVAPNQLAELVQLTMDLLMQHKEVLEFANSLMELLHDCVTATMDRWKSPLIQVWDNISIVQNYVALGQHFLHSYNTTENKEKKSWRECAEHWQSTLQHLILMGTLNFNGRIITMTHFCTWACYESSICKCENCDAERQLREKFEKAWNLTFVRHLVACENAGHVIVSYVKFVLLLENEKKDTTLSHDISMASLGFGYYVRNKAQDILFDLFHTKDVKLLFGEIVKSVAKQAPGAKFNAECRYIVNLISMLVRTDPTFEERNVTQEMALEWAKTANDLAAILQNHPKKIMDAFIFTLDYCHMFPNNQAILWSTAPQLPSAIIAALNRTEMDGNHHHVKYLYYVLESAKSHIPSIAKEQIYSKLISRETMIRFVSTMECDETRKHASAIFGQTNSANSANTKNKTNNAKPQNSNNNNNNNSNKNKAKNKNKKKKSQKKKK